MSESLRDQFKAILAEFDPAGPHAGEALGKKILHAVRGSLTISIDVMGKLDDKDQEADLQSLSAEIELLLKEIAAKIGRPALTIAVRFFGASAIESSLIALSNYTGGVDDFMRDYIMPSWHELRETVVELDDALIEAFAEESA